MVVRAGISLSARFLTWGGVAGPGGPGPRLGEDGPAAHLVCGERDQEDRRCTHRESVLPAVLVADRYGEDQRERVEDDPRPRPGSSRSRGRG